MDTRRSPSVSGLVGHVHITGKHCIAHQQPSPSLPSPPLPSPPSLCPSAGFGTCLLSLLAGIVLGLFDLRAEKLLKRKEGKVGDVIRLKDILHFPVSLWLVFAVCVLYYVTVFPFIGLAM